MKCKCKRCGKDTIGIEVIGEDGYETGYVLNLCDDCNEAGIEEYEERKRERIARKNEY